MSACAQKEGVPTAIPATAQVSKTASPTTADQYLEQAKVFSKENRYELAMQDLTKAIELDPEYAEAYFERSKTYPFEDEADKSAAWDKSLEDCDKAIEIDPRYAAAHYLRGVAYMGKKEYDKAVSELTMAQMFGITKEDILSLKGVTDLAIAPGDLILLDMQCHASGGRDCHGNPMPYVNTLDIRLFANPGEAAVEINKIYISPPIGMKAEIMSPIRYFASSEIEHLTASVSSSAQPNNAETCKCDYKSASDSQYKQSNEVSCKFRMSY